MSEPSTNDNLTELFTNAVTSKDIPLIRDYIYQGVDVTINGNYALNYAIDEADSKLTETLLEERFNVLKASNPILTLLGSLVAKNRTFIEKMKEEFTNPKVVLYALYHCTPKESNSKPNKELINNLIDKVSMDVLEEARLIAQELVKSPKTSRPRMIKTLEIIQNEREKKIKYLILKKISPNKTTNSRALSLE